MSVKQAMDLRIFQRYDVVYSGFKKAEMLTNIISKSYNHQEEIVVLFFYLK